MHYTIFYDTDYGCYIDGEGRLIPDLDIYIKALLQQDSNITIDFICSAINTL